MRRLAMLLVAVLAAPAVRPDALSAVQMLRIGGCGGLIAASRPLEHADALDRAAERWADGQSLAAATGLAGYSAQAAQGLHVTGPDEPLIRELRRTECHAVAGRELREVGIYRRRGESWLVLASPVSAPVASAPSVRPPAHTTRTPPRAGSPVLASRALELVNEARARGARCGSQSFGPAPPLTLSGTLGNVAFGHANDMAVHDYFEHQDLTGQSPADRVRAVGYHEKLVGENLAYGPQSVEEVVKGWLDSPGHCENIMDPRFEQMGIAAATGRATRRGLFWVQLLAEPRA